jgi:hypothetical protein
LVHHSTKRSQRREQAQEYRRDAAARSTACSRPCTAAAVALLLSIVIFSGRSCGSIARSKKRQAAAPSRWAVLEVHRVAEPVESTIQILPL